MADSTNTEGEVGIKSPDVPFTSHVKLRHEGRLVYKPPTKAVSTQPINSNDLVVGHNTNTTNRRD